MDNFFVGSEYRTNPKSLIPGGYDVKVYYSDKPARVYDKIKNPEAYIERIRLNDPTITKCEILGPSKN